MQVQHLPLYQFLEGSGKSFIIPVYQRDYAWTRVNCQKLWDDLVELKNESRVDHFLGTLVTIGSGFQEYTVIDGQQRLTTASILLVALQAFLKNREPKSDSEKILSEQILDFLINKYSPEHDKRIRLKPNKQDKEYFDALFTDKPHENADSNILSNYYFFREKIATEILSPEELFNAFRKLKIVLIDLVRGQDDPQLIFESLNSTGVDLTAGDLIRNYILMDLQPREQEKLYKTFWIDIEKSTGNVAEFVRNYLIFKTKTWVKNEDIYSVFKKFALDNFNKDKVSVLEDLSQFAKIYSHLVQLDDYPIKIVNERLKRLNKLEFTVSHPYLLDVFNDLKSNILSDQTVKDVLTLIESYAFRKMLVDNSTQGLNKMFISLARDIKKEKSWQENYLDILSFILLEKGASQRFPNNDEFENALITKEVYRLQAKNRNFLLESLENYNSSIQIAVDELTVEHIMPQTLTKEWKHKLGVNWQDIHKKYLHTIGNLSLTAKNTELSNKTFDEKQRIDYQTSKLKLNCKLDGLKIWNEEKIVERAQNLVQFAKDIWPFPKTNYKKPIPDEQIFDLTNEDSFSGTKPSRLYFENDERGIELKSWRDFLTRCCKYLFEFSPTQFSEIQCNPEFAVYFNIDKPLKYPLEFIQNKYVEGNISANGAIALLSKICQRIKYPAENISFSIRNLTD